MPAPSLLRSALSDLSTIAAGDLRNLWQQVTTAVEAQEALADVLPALVSVYGTAAASIAADWYDELRDELEVKRRFSAIPAGLGDTGGAELASWGVRPLFSEEPDWQAARTLIEGGLQRRIVNAGRDTIVESSLADPSAQGWQRQAAGGCAFCQMLASRGVVFSESSADFASHDHCQCVAVPAFDGHPRLVKPYTPSDRNITDADRSRVSAYLDDHDEAG